MILASPAVPLFRRPATPPSGTSCRTTRRAAARAGGLAALAAALLLLAPAAARAQDYPVAPSAVLDMSDVGTRPEFSGYVSARQLRHGDTTSFLVNRARLTLMLRPAPGVGVRVQTDFTARGHADGDSSVAAFSLTDAWISLAPPDSTTAIARALHPTVLVGQFRTPYSLEFLTSYTTVRTADRAMVVDSIATRRDIGAYARIVPVRWLHVDGAVVNGEGSNHIENTDGREMYFGRVVLLPLPGLAVAGKWGGQAGDHLWGYDARWVAGPALLEGEVLQRAVGFAPTRDTRSGGYLLAAVKLRPWLQPVAQWQQYREEGAATANATLSTVGVNLLSPGESLRLLVDWTHRVEQPTARASNELVAQVMAVF